jgi:mannose-6-phosphate isomerase-like protein (cupin superfamily)
MVIRNWKDATPTVAHETALIWSIFRQEGTAGLSEEEAPMLAASGFTLHMMQSGKAGDYHMHNDKEQIYYFTRGYGKMKIDDEIYPVEPGDAVHLPPHTYHQLINDSDDWIEHILVTVPVVS